MDVVAGKPELRETLIKCSFSTTSIDKVAPDEISKQAKDTGDDDGDRAICEEDAAGDILGRDGASVAVAKLCGLIEPHYPKPGNE
jgi:hypothetical protein